MEKNRLIEKLVFYIFVELRKLNVDLSNSSCLVV
jgi:hypothetical protein